MKHLEGLNERQKTAVLATEGPVLIVAGAGAGKTKTIVHRIAHLISQGTPARNILAVTFTNKAAQEMRERVRKLLGDIPGGAPLATTFHALGARLLREFHTEAGLVRSFAIWDRDDQMRTVKRLVKELGMEEYQPRAVLSSISRRKGEGETYQELERDAAHFRDKAIARLWRAYEGALHEEGAVDFDDLLSKTLTVMQKNPDVLAKLRNRWTHITIDEYQDTNRTQYEMARLLALPLNNLCVVGDGDQNIYSWRGAEMEHILAFDKEFPSVTSVLLEQNYRSTRTILSTANAVIAKNKRRHEKNLFTDNPTGDPIMLYSARNETDEAWFVAQSVQKLMEGGTAPGEIAVLYRENFQSRVLEEALLAFGLNYRVLGTRFFERAEVKDVLSYLRVALNPKSRNDLLRIIAVPPRGIGKTTLEKMLAAGDEPMAGAAGLKVEQFKMSLAKIRHAAETLPASDAVRYATEESGIEKMLSNDKEEGKERLANVQELVNLAVRYDNEECPGGIERLLEEAALQSEQDSMKDERNSLSLMTVHASKGLEFDAVFITGLEQGLFPSQREGERDEEEERRLFYVAVTRARKHLYVSHARERMKYGSRDMALPSEFLADIDDRLLAQARPKRSLLDDVFID